MSAIIIPCHDEFHRLFVGALKKVLQTNVVDQQQLRVEVSPESFALPTHCRIVEELGPCVTRGTARTGRILVAFRINRGGPSRQPNRVPAEMS